MFSLRATGLEHLRRMVFYVESQVPKMFILYSNATDGFRRFITIEQGAVHVNPVWPISALAYADLDRVANRK